MATKILPLMPENSSWREGDSDSDDGEVEERQVQRWASLRSSISNNTLLRDVLDISDVLTEGAAAMIDDSFLKCFNSRRSDPWNWNMYLWPCWVLGVIIR